MKKEKCPECDGTMEKKKVDFSMYGVSLGKFPALVCKKCAAQYFEDEVTDKIDKIAKEKGLWGLESHTTVAKVGNSYCIRISKKLFDFLGLKKGEEVTLYPEDKHKLVLQV